MAYGCATRKNTYRVLTRDKVLESWVIVLLKEMYLNNLIHEKNTQTAMALLFCFVKSAKLVKSANWSGWFSNSANWSLILTIE